MRVTVLVIAGVATLLAALTVAAFDSAEHDDVLVFIAVWWSFATVAGAIAGTRAPVGPGSSLSRLLAESRTENLLPDATPAGVALRRLWPLGVFALAAGACALAGPQIPAVGTGFAIIWALAWRRHEPAVAAIEDRDGVRFFVRPTHAHQPLELVRVPGFGGERKATLGDAPVPRG